MNTVIVFTSLITEGIPSPYRNQGMGGMIGMDDDMSGVVGASGGKSKGVTTCETNFGLGGVTICRVALGDTPSVKHRIYPKQEYSSSSIPVDTLVEDSSRTPLFVSFPVKPRAHYM